MLEKSDRTWKGRLWWTVGQEIQHHLKGSTVHEMGWGKLTAAVLPTRRQVLQTVRESDGVDAQNHLRSSNTHCGAAIEPPGMLMSKDYAEASAAVKALKPWMRSSRRSLSSSIPILTLKRSFSTESSVMVRHSIKLSTPPREVAW